MLNSRDSKTSVSPSLPADAAGLNLGPDGPRRLSLHSAAVEEFSRGDEEFCTHAAFPGLRNAYCFNVTLAGLARYVHNLCGTARGPSGWNSASDGPLGRKVKNDTSHIPPAALVNRSCASGAGAANELNFERSKYVSERQQRPERADSASDPDRFLGRR